MTKFNNIRNNKTTSTICENKIGVRRFFIFGILMIYLAASSPVVDAGCSCSAGNWDPYSFLNSELGTSQPVQPSSAQNSATGNSGSSTQKPQDRAASFPNDHAFKSMKSVSSSDVVIDVSNGDSYAQSHIKSAIHIPTREFLNGDGNLKTSEELAKVLGDAGLSRDDSAVLYGSKESSGEPEFAFWVLSYLGQKGVNLLDGSLADWKDAGLPVESSANQRPGVEYRSEVSPKLLADYEYVKSGQAQILDVRPFAEFGKGRIKGSSAFDAANVIKGDKMKDADGLSIVFSRLNKDQPIVVYSSDYSRSSLVWYALHLMGYEASVYTWEDWKAHEAMDSQAASATSEGSTAGSKYTKLGTT